MSTVPFKRALGVDDEQLPQVARLADAQLIERDARGLLGRGSSARARPSRGPPSPAGNP